MLSAASTTVLATSPVRCRRVQAGPRATMWACSAARTESTMRAPASNATESPVAVARARRTKREQAPEPWPDRVQPPADDHRINHSCQQPSLCDQGHAADRAECDGSERRAGGRGLAAKKTFKLLSVAAVGAACLVMPRHGPAHRPFERRRHSLRTRWRTSRAKEEHHAGNELQRPRQTEDGGAGKDTEYRAEQKKAQRAQIP